MNHQIPQQHGSVASSFHLLNDLPAHVQAMIMNVAPYTMTSRERLASLAHAVEQLEARAIEGDIVECGVWKGGSMMLVALMLLAMGKTHRDIYLFDTFTGMSEPTDADVQFDGTSAVNVLDSFAKDTGAWCYAGLEDVQNNLRLTQYPDNKLHFVKGMVEQTIPDHAPEKIALLRLDTDWYESTRHELEHLYPRLVKGGVLIIDDYGHWKGSRAAVDEYLAKYEPTAYLHRIDYTGRILIKP
jgi:hypothetical protein